MRSLRVIPLLLVAAACDCGDKVVKVASPLSVTPSTLDFGGVPVGTGADAEFVLKNSGPVDLVVGEPVLSEHGDDAGEEFRIRKLLDRVSCVSGEHLGPAKAQGVVEAGGCAVISIRYVPLERAGDSATLNLSVQEEGATALELPIVGHGIGPEVEVCAVAANGVDEVCNQPGQPPIVLDFGIVPLETEARRLIRLKNTGDSALTVKAAEIRNGDPSFTTDPASLAGQMPAGRVATLEAIFVPTLGGTRTAVYQVESDDEDEKAVEVHFTARGDAPRLCFTQAPTLDFGRVDAGSDKIMDAELVNCGTQDFELRQLTISTSSPFTLVTPPPLPITLRPMEAGTDDRLTVQVRFAPQSGGQFDAALNARADFAINAGTLLLTGNGRAAPTCQIGLAATSLNFGSTVANTGTVQKDLVLQNLGENPCTVSQPTITAGASVEFRVVPGTTYPFTLDPARQRNIRLEYAPKSTGNHTGEVSIPTNDPVKQTIKVALIGSATQSPICKIDIVPAATSVWGAVLNYGQVLIGREKTQSVLVKNIGSGACTVGGAQVYQTFGATGANPFSITSAASSYTGTLAIGAQFKIDIKFKPPGESQYVSQFYGIQINTSDTGPAGGHSCSGFGPYMGQAGCRQVGLAGEGVRSPISVVPGELDFGVITLGCPVSKKIVTIYNLGSQAVTINSITIDPAGGPFTIVSAPPTPYTLGAGKDEKVRVGYAPTAAQADTGNLVIDTSLGTTTVPLTGAGTTDSFQVDRFTQAQKPKVDVLFVVDDSGSMGDKQQALSDNGGRFMQTAANLNTDYQIGVVTTDVDGPHEACSGGIFGLSCDSGWPNDTIEPGVLFGHPKIITNTTQNAVDAFKKNIRPGTEGSGSEKGLRAAEMALSDPLINDPAKNLGFLREDAKLSIVFVSDEEDSSKGTIDYYADFFKAIKGYRNASLLSMAVIVGDEPGGCQTSGSPYYSADAGARYIGVSNRANGLFRSICTTDWGRVAEDLGLDAFGARAEFFLSRQADPTTIQVKVNNVSSPAGDWTYDGTANSVIFAAAKVPGPGAQIEISYNSTCPP